MQKQERKNILLQNIRVNCKTMLTSRLLGHTNKHVRTPSKGDEYNARRQIPLWITKKIQCMTLSHEPKTWKKRLDVYGSQRHPRGSCGVFWQPLMPPGNLWTTFGRLPKTRARRRWGGPLMPAPKISNTKWFRWSPSIIRCYAASFTPLCRFFCFGADGDRLPKLVVLLLIVVYSLVYDILLLYYDSRE